MNVLIIICAWCPEKNMFRTLYSEKWRPITKLVLKYVAEPSHQSKISHGICPACEERLNKQIEFQERSIRFVKEAERRPEMVGTVGEEYYDEEGENEDVRPPIVMHCLKEGCELTSWYGMDHWEISVDRSDGMKSGRYTSMMGLGGCCPKHRGNITAEDAA